MNHGVLIGRLCKDITIVTTQSGTKVAKFSLAVYESKQKTHFFNMVAFNKTAELLGAHVSKGSKLAVEYRLSQDNWTDKDGKKRSSVSCIVGHVEFLDNNKKDAPAPSSDEGGEEPPLPTPSEGDGSEPNF